MSPRARLAFVVAGYAAAFAAAGIALRLRVAHTQGPGAQSSAGMFAFGDALLAAGVFAAVALVPTALAVGPVLRNPAARRVLVTVALAAAAMALLLLVFLGMSGAQRPS